MSKIHALRVELFIPPEIATGEQVPGRALVFAKYACGIAEPQIVEVRDAIGGTWVLVKESDYAVTRRSAKRTG